MPASSSCYHYAGKRFAANKQVIGRTGATLRASHRPAVKSLKEYRPFADGSARMRSLAVQTRS